METVGKNNQDRDIYETIEKNKDEIIEEIDEYVQTEQLTSAILNFFDVDDVNSFIEFLNDEGIIYIDKLDN